MDALHLPSLALALISLGFIKFYPASWAKVVPAQIAAVVGGTLAIAMVDGPAHLSTGIETIGSHFGSGAIPNHLPMPGVPEALTLETVPELIKPAATIALLAAIESLLCARVSDTMVGRGGEEKGFKGRGGGVKPLLLLLPCWLRSSCCCVHAS